MNEKETVANAALTGWKVHGMKVSDANGLPLLVLPRKNEWSVYSHPGGGAPREIDVLQLAAAAPDLLEAAKLALERWGKLEGSGEIGKGYSDKTGDRLRAAIAKAEGR